MSGLSHNERMKLLAHAAERGDFGPARAWAVQSPAAGPPIQFALMRSDRKQFYLGTQTLDGSIIVNFDHRPLRAA